MKKRTTSRCVVPFRLNAVQDARDLSRGVELLVVRAEQDLQRHRDVALERIATKTESEQAGVLYRRGKFYLALGNDFLVPVTSYAPQFWCTSRHTLVRPT